MVFMKYISSSLLSLLSFVQFFALPQPCNQLGRWHILGLGSCTHESMSILLKIDHLFEMGSPRAGPRWLAEARHESALRHWETATAADLFRYQVDTSGDAEVFGAQDTAQRRALAMQKQTQKRIESGFKFISWTVSTSEGVGSIYFQLSLKTYFLTILTSAQRTCVHFCPQHWLLFHLGVYSFELEFILGQLDASR